MYPTLYRRITFACAILALAKARQNSGSSNMNIRSPVARAAPASVRGCAASPLATVLLLMGMFASALCRYRTGGHHFAGRS